MRSSEIAEISSLSVCDRFAWASTTSIEEEARATEAEEPLQASRPEPPPSGYRCGPLSALVDLDPAAYHCGCRPGVR